MEDSSPRRKLIELKQVDGIAKPHPDIHYEPFEEYLQRYTTYNILPRKGEPDKWVTQTPAAKDSGKAMFFTKTNSPIKR